MKIAFLILICAELILWSQNAIAAPSQTRVNIRVITDEADAVLALLTKRKANQSLTDADWQRIFSSEGYVRLKKRETSRGASG